MADKRARKSADTKARLIAAARALFAEQGYAGTATEEILARAETTRGGLYHHYADKADLFAAVCTVLHEEAVAAIEAAGGRTPFERLRQGCEAWMEYMAAPAARRILLVEGPGVLGWARWNDLDRAHGFALLRQGVQAAQAAGALRPIDTDALALLLNGAMNQAVLAAGDDAALAPLKRAFHSLLEALRP